MTNHVAFDGEKNIVKLEHIFSIVHSTTARNHKSLFLTFNSLLTDFAIEWNMQKRLVQ